MTILYEQQIQEYFDIILKRFHSGKITEDKFSRLYDKIEEWQTHAKRKGSIK